MSHETFRTEIDLSMLKGVTPFILAVDSNLAVRWASPSIMERFDSLETMNAADMIQFWGATEKITPEIVAANMGRYSQIALIDGDPPTPLTGWWFASGEGYILMAGPWIRNKEDLDLGLLSLEDFPEDGHLIDLTIAKDEYAATLNEARTTIQTMLEDDRQRELVNRRKARGRARRRAAPRKEKQPEVQPEQDDWKAWKQVPSVAACALFTIDRDSVVTSVNDAFCAMTGFSESETKGRKWDQIGFESDWPLFNWDNGETVSNKICRIKTKDDHWITILANTEWLRDPSDGVTGGLASFVDVTTLVETQRKMEAFGQAGKAWASRKVNEIHSSMKGIKEMMELVLKSDMRTEQREYLEAILGSTSSLLDVLNNSTEYSRIQEGGIESRSVEFSLRSRLGEALKPLVFRARDKGIEMAFRIPADLPDALKGDPVWLRQIMVNLVDNAVKYTDKGKIVVQVQSDSQTEDEIDLHFCVQDTGIGITPENQDRIFEPYAWLAGPEKDDGWITGTGLAVSARMAELMEGQLWVESEITKGSMFHFTAKCGLMQVVEAEAPELETRQEATEPEDETVQQQIPEQEQEVVEEIEAETAAQEQEIEEPVEAQVQEVVEPVEEEAPVQVQEVVEPVEEEAPVQVQEVVEPVEEEAPAQVQEVVEPVEEEAPAQVQEVVEPVEEEAPDQVQEVVEPVEEEAPAQVQEVVEPVEEEAPAQVQEVVEPIEAEAPVQVQEVVEPIEVEAPAQVQEVVEPIEVEAPAQVQEAVEPVKAEVQQPAVKAAKPVPQQKSAPQQQPVAVKEQAVAVEEPVKEKKPVAKKKAAPKKKPAAKQPKSAATKKPAAKDEQTMDAMPVLVVDSDSKSRRTFKEILSAWKMKPTAVNGGQAALAALRRASDTDKPYAMILIDNETQEVGNYNLIEMIQQTPKIAGAKIVLITNKDDPMDEERRQELKIAACLMKPVSPSGLLETIQSVLGVKAAAAGATAAPKPDFSLSDTVNRLKTFNPTFNVQEEEGQPSDNS